MSMRQGFIVTKKLQVNNYGYKFIGVNHGKNQTA